MQGSQVAVIGYQLWQKRFGGDASVQKMVLCERSLRPEASIVPQLWGDQSVVSSIRVGSSIRGVWARNLVPLLVPLCTVISFFSVTFVQCG
jgi:hypothetical protein